MKLNGVVLWPSSELAQVSVATTVEEAKKYLPQMWDIIQKAPGVGLAAIQIGVPIRMFVMDSRNEFKLRYAFMNPEIVELIGDPVEINEACLSAPGISEKVVRYPEVLIRATNIESETEPRLFLCYGLEAQCVQHEQEHLDGKFFIDNLEPGRRGMAKKRAEKQIKRLSK